MNDPIYYTLFGLVVLGAFVFGICDYIRGYRRGKRREAMIHKYPRGFYHEGDYYAPPDFRPKKMPYGIPTLDPNDVEDALIIDDFYPSGSSLTSKGGTTSNHNWKIYKFTKIEFEKDTNNRDQDDQTE